MAIPNCYSQEYKELKRIIEDKNLTIILSIPTVRRSSLWGHWVGNLESETFTLYLDIITKNREDY